DGTVTAGGSGTVSVVGTGGPTSDPLGHDYGVVVTSGNSQVTSNNGNVSVTGTGGGSTTSGILGDGGPSITAPGSNSLTLTGLGASTGGISISGTVSSASGALDATAASFIAVKSGAKVETSSGNLTLSANQQAIPTSGNFVGIDVNNATV